MNILYSLPFWPYLYTPWLFREIAWMRKQGHRVAVVSLRDPPGPSADLSSFGLQDIPVLQVRRRIGSDRDLVMNLMGLGLRGAFTAGSNSLAQSVGASGWRQGLHEWASFKKVIRFTRGFKADVIEAHWAAEAADLACQIRLAVGIPYAVRLHGGDLHKAPSPALPKIVEHASAVCPVSQFLAGLLLGQRPVARLPQVPKVDLDPSKLRVCHNGLPNDAIATEPVRQSADLQRIGTIGRLDPEKHHNELILAVADLVKDFSGVRLRIIGGGQLQKKLEALAESKGVRGRVEITGAQPWESVMKMAREHHLYVQASEVEGCSLATVEGQAQGVPVVLSRTGAHAQSVEEGVNGYLFDTGDVDALKDRLGRVLSAAVDRRQEMGAQSIRLIRERFCFDMLMPRVEAILEAVRTGRPLPG